MKPNRAKRDNYIHAVQRLAEAIADYRTYPIDTVRDGVIQRFEFTFELAWKSLKEYMMEAGLSHDLQFPKMILKEAYAAELIDDEKVWLSMLESRNMTSHIYDDHTAAKVANAIITRYLPELQRLAEIYQK